MAKTTAHNDIILMRRERVAALLARGLTQREIQQALADVSKPGQYLINPDTGNPFDIAQINRDIQVLRQQARNAASKSVDEHRARQFAELQEVKRAAWAARDPKAALQAIGLEMKLLGTTQATEINITLNVSIELVNKTVKALSDAGYDPALVFNDLIAEAARERANTDSASSTG